MTDYDGVYLFIILCALLWIALELHMFRIEINQWNVFREEMRKLDEIESIIEKEKGK